MVEKNMYHISVLYCRKTLKEQLLSTLVLTTMLDYLSFLGSILLLRQMLSHSHFTEKITGSAR